MAILLPLEVRVIQSWLGVLVVYFVSKRLEKTQIETDSFIQEKVPLHFLYASLRSFEIHGH
jgi:hypothetical protein